MHPQIYIHTYTAKHSDISLSKLLYTIFMKHPIQHFGYTINILSWREIKVRQNIAISCRALSERGSNFSCIPDNLGLLQIQGGRERSFDSIEFTKYFIDISELVTSLDRHLKQWKPHIVNQLPQFSFFRSFSFFLLHFIILFIF